MTKNVTMLQIRTDMTKNHKNMTYMTQQKTLNFHQKAYMNIIYLFKTQNKAL